MLSRSPVAALSALFFFAPAALSACGGDAPAAPEGEPPAEEPTPAEVEPEPEIAEPPPPPPVTASTHDVLFLVVHEAPLLSSEERLFGVLETRLGRRNDLERREAIEEEAAFAEAYLSAEGAARPVAFPATFGRASRVIVMRVPAPRVRSDGDLVSRGVVGVLSFRPPSLEPAFEARIDESSSWRLADDQWSSWLTGLLREPEDG